jgi:hypothetical protein
MVNPFLWLILTILDIYFWIILAMVIMSWLIGFNVINGSNPYVRQISSGGCCPISAGSISPPSCCCWPCNS